MLQLMEHAAITEHGSTMHFTTDILSVKNKSSVLYCTCGKCRYVNKVSNNFCTNCGYPVKEKEENSALYHVRVKQRAEILRKGEQTIQAARIVVYILAIFLFTGIGFLFGDLDSRYLLVLSSVVFSMLFFLLAYWSYTKPFIALTTALILVLTFSVIAIFGEFINAFKTVVGVYSILISMVIVYFLLKGVQGAYRAELIKEEMEIV
jgi:hypothetical protein